MIVLDLSILNQKGTPMFNSDLTANRPAAAIVGRIFIATDSPYGIFRDTGTAWDQISSAGGADTNIYNTSGTLTANRVVSDGGFGLSFTPTTHIGTAAIGGGGSGKLIVGSSTADNGIQVFGANAPSLRIDNAQSGGTQRFVFGLATATNNFIQGATAGQFCISTQSVGEMLFGMWNGTNGSEVFRLSTANNLIVGSSVDTGEKVQITGTAKVTSTLSANSFVKSGGTSAQILAADGSVITAGTNITISGGTISSSGGGGSMSIGGSITGATAGSVLFAGAAGILQQDNANFFWDDTNNRLAIGTTSATEKLHVVGNILISNGTQNAIISNRKGASSVGFNIWIGNGGVNTGGSGASGSYNVSLGYEALLNATTAQSNIAIGYNALKTNSTGNQNIAIGYNSLQTATGGLNTSIGFQSLSSLTSGISNSALGYNSAFFLTTGNENTAIGYESLVGATTSTGNTAVGYRSVYGSGGNHNSGLGYLSLQSVTAEQNTALGAFSLRYSTSGTQNVAIGYNAGVGTGVLYNTTGSNNIFIGTNSVGASSTESNRTFIGNDSTITSWIGGNLILGTKTTTGEKIQITGTIRINGQTSATAGGSAGLHLIVNLDGTNYKIALLNV